MDTGRRYPFSACGKLPIDCSIILCTSLVDYAASCVEKKPDRYRLEPQRRGRLLPSSASPLSSAESKREKTPDGSTLDTERRGEASLICLPRRFLILHASPPLPTYPQESHKHHHYM